MSPALQPDSLRDYAATKRQSLESWPTLLVVDGDFEVARILVSHFEKRGFHAASATTAAEARALLLRRAAWTLVLADVHLPDGTGLELHAWLREHQASTPLLLMSGSPFCATLCAGLDFVAKPFSLARIDEAVRNVVSRR